MISLAVVEAESRTAIGQTGFGDPLVRIPEEHVESQQPGRRTAVHDPLDGVAHEPRRHQQTVARQPPQTSDQRHRGPRVPRRAPA